MKSKPDPLGPDSLLDLITTIYDIYQVKRKYWRNYK
jgi:hypothetical protein